MWKPCDFEPRRRPLIGAIKSTAQHLRSRSIFGSVRKQSLIHGRPYQRSKQSHTSRCDACAPSPGQLRLACSFSFLAVACDNGDGFPFLPWPCLQAWRTRLCGGASYERLALQRANAFQNKDGALDYPEGTEARARQDSEPDCRVNPFWVRRNNHPRHQRCMSCF